jgi:hypothetical protein
MAYYRVYLLNAAGHIFFGKGIECDSDAAAVAAAVVIANTEETLQHNATEVWAGVRMVAHLATEESDMMGADPLVLHYIARALDCQRRVNHAVTVDIVKGWRWVGDSYQRFAVAAMQKSAASDSRLPLAASLRA